MPRLIGDHMNLKLMTYNIKSGYPLGRATAKTNVSGAAEVIRASGAEIIGLNEVHGCGKPDTLFPFAQAERIASSLGYHCFFGRSIMEHGCDPYGNAIISKYPIVEAKVIPIPEPENKENCRHYEARTICRCVIEIPDGEGGFKYLAVYSSHYGLSAPEHACAVKTTLETIAEEKLPYVFMGDLNMQPDNPIIAPLFDAMRDTEHLLEEKLTFPSDVPNCKIDYLFTSDGIGHISAEVLNTLASDHRPIVCDVEI